VLKVLYSIDGKSSFSRVSQIYTLQGKMEETKPNRKELLAMLDEMNKSFDNLPIHAQMSFVTNCDLNAALLLVSEILRAPQD